MATLEDVHVSDPKARPRFWSVYTAMAGYLPESDVAVFDDWSFAFDYAWDECEEHCDGLSMLDEDLIPEGLEPHSIMATISAAKVDSRDWSFAVQLSERVWLYCDEVSPEDVEVCAECGTIHDVDPFGCWCCGSRDVSSASDYYSA